MQRRDAIDRMAADTRQVRHAHVTLAALLDQRQPLDALLVTEECHAYLVEETRIDLVDDLEQTRQQPSEQASGQRPRLEQQL